MKLRSENDAARKQNASREATKLPISKLDKPAPERPEDEAGVEQQLEEPAEQRLMTNPRRKRQEGSQCAPDDNSIEA